MEKSLIILVCLVSFSAFAEDLPQYRSCSQVAKTQAEINTCASDEAARADAALDDMYRKLLSQAAGEQEAVAKIKAAEKAWVVYRDAYMDAMYPATNKQAEYGTVYPTEANLLRAKLTRRQFTALSEMLQQYNGDEGSKASTP